MTTNEIYLKFLKRNKGQQIPITRRTQQHLRVSQTIGVYGYIRHPENFYLTFTLPTRIWRNGAKEIQLNYSSPTII